MVYATYSNGLATFDTAEQAQLAVAGGHVYVGEFVNDEAADAWATRMTMIRSIGYFAGARRVGLLAYMADGCAIGGFGPEDFGVATVDVTTTVVDDGGEVLREFPRYLHPDDVFAEFRVLGE